MKRIQILLIIVVLLSGGCVQPPESVRPPGFTQETLDTVAETYLITVTPETIFTQISSQPVNELAVQTDEPDHEPQKIDPVRTQTWAEPCQEAACYFPYKPILSNPISSQNHQEIESTYRYGTTQSGERIPHDGVEFYNPAGTPVYAAAEGTVVFAGNDIDEQWGRYKNFYGKMVLLRHEIDAYPETIFTLYAHLSEITITNGDTVAQGDMIGKVGASGGAMGSHLHFEVRSGQPGLNFTRNPEFFLPLRETMKGQKTGILVGTAKDATGSILLQTTIVLQPILNGESNNRTVYLETYANNIPSIPEWQENFAVSQLPAGDYRLTAFLNDKLIEKIITIRENEILFLSIQVED